MKLGDPLTSLQLPTGGVTGNLINKADWNTSLGPATSWPQCLRAILELALMSKLPMALFWVNESIILYNETFQDIFTDSSTENQCAEIWRVIKPFVEQVLTDCEAMETEPILLSVGRNKASNKTYYTLYLSRVNDETGHCAGVFLTCIETPDTAIFKELKESKNQLEFAIDAAELGTWDYNPLSNKFSSNRRLKEWFGLPPNEQIELTHATNTILESDREKVIEAIQKAMDFSSGGYYDIEYSIVHPISKKHTYVRAKGRAWFNEENVCYRFNGILEDITEQKIAETKLRESVERYENLIRSSPFAIGILRSEKLNITTANQAIIDIWGKGWEIMGKSYFEALPELADQGYRAVFGQVYNTGIPFNAVETPVNILQNGKMQLKYYNFLLYAQRNIQEEIDGIGIIATEVTSQALFNKQIQENEKRFRLLADSMPQLVWTTDPGGRLSYFNQSLADYSGLSPEQLGQEGWQQIVYPADRNRTNDTWVQSMKAGEDFLLDHRLRNHTGEYRWHLSRAIPQKDEAGAIQMWVGTSTDIQEQKIFTSELEKQVTERTKELEKNNIELAKMNKDLQAFAYISSHDLQEPLRKIQTFATRIADLERANLSDQGKHYCDRMNDAALRMQTLIEDLLAYSRTNAADRKFEKCDLNKVVEEVKEDFHDELQQKNAIFETSGLCEANIIPFQFRQLIQNLISNAIKFSSEERPLKINITADISDAETFDNDKLSAGVKYCRIRIVDNGIGFEQKYSDKIFEVFQRIHGRQQYTGTGIGLAIVKRIAENHGGIVTATGELDQGSIFDIYIPGIVSC